MKCSLAVVSLMKLTVKMVLMFSLKVFNEARGHRMERENYLEDLRRREPDR